MRHSVIEIDDDSKWKMCDDSDDWIVCVRPDGDYHVKMKDFMWMVETELGTR